ncbi:MAG: ATP-binding protein [bacterium]
MKKRSQISDNEVRYHELVNNLRSGIAIYEAIDDGNDFIIKDLNKAGETASKVLKEDILGVSVRKAFPAVTEIGLFEVFQRVYKTGKSERLPLPLYKDQRIAEWVENFVFKLPTGEIVSIYDDLSGFKIIEEKLSKSEERLQLSLEISEIGLWDWHIPTSKVFFSNVYFTMAGYRPGEFEASFKGWASHVHPEDIEAANAKVNEALLHPEKEYKAEFRFRCKDGSYIWILAKGRIVETDTARKPLRMLGTHTNITALKEHADAEHRKALEAVERQKILFEISRLFHIDFKKTWEAITEKASGILKADRVSIWTLSLPRKFLICEDLYIRKTKVHALEEEFDCNLYPNYYRALEDSRFIDAEDGMADPRTRDFTNDYLAPLSILSLLDVPVRKGGELSGVICFEYTEKLRKWSLEEKEFAASLADLVSAKFETLDRQRTEKELVFSEKRYRNMVDNALIGVFRTRPDGAILFANTAMAKMFQFDSPEDLSKRNIQEFYKNLTDRKKLLDILEREKIIRNFEVDLVTKSGAILTGQVNAYKEEDQIVGMIMDITDQKKILQDLNVSRVKAEESDRLKTSLLANMSHELRTPMNSILGFSDLLLNESHDPETIFYTNKIHVSGKRLMNTLHAILELADLETTREKLAVREIDLLKVLSSVTVPFQTQASNKGLYLVTEFTHRIIVLADEKLLKLVFQNLVDNAVKFTEEGGVTVETALVESEGSYQAKIMFKDTGIGIVRENFETIFEEFRQASEGYNRMYEGTGLGLTLSKKMVEMMGGKITVESESGLGSIFTVWLPAVMKGVPPLEVQETVADREIYVPTVIKVHTPVKLPLVLIVEDNEDNAEIVKLYLKSMCRVDRAPDSKSALKMITKNQYQAIMMDINLGTGMDGLKITREIRAMENYQKTPIIAITGYTMSGDRDKILAAGCSHYIAKPFNKALLTDVLSSALSVNRPGNLDE